MKVTLPNS